MVQLVFVSIFNAKFLRKHQCVVDLDKRVLCAGGIAVLMHQQTIEPVHMYVILHLLYCYPSTFPDATFCSRVGNQGDWNE